MSKKSDFMIALLIFAGLVSALPAVAGDPPAPPAQKQAAPAATPAAGPPTQAPAANTITQAAAKAGALACTTRVNQVSNFLMSGSQDVGALLFSPPADADKRLFSVSMGIPVANGLAAYASASFAPNQANGCGATYETVVYWTQGCDLVAEKNFSGLKRTGALSKTIAVLGAPPEATIFLMPAGTGCVSIKKEVVQ